MTTSDQHVLVLRFSSLGDALLLIPVFRTLEKTLPDLKITLVTRQDWKDFFSTCSNVEVFGVDLNGEHTGFGGLWKLFRELKDKPWAAVVDLHDVLRTRILTQLFSWQGIPVHRYDKRRRQRRAILSGNRDIALPSISQQYLEAFAFLGPDLTLISGPWLEIDSVDGANQIKQIAIAPFSSHKAKEWPIEHWKHLLSYIYKSPYEVQVFCLAYSAREIADFEKLKDVYPELNLVDGNVEVSEQVRLMATMDAAISVDSANMHLAAITGVPVISLWGTTMPELGFRPLEMEDYILLADNKIQRPRSVYGRINSKKGLAQIRKAMASIDPKEVADLLRQIISG